MTRLLVINPNASQSMTDSLEKELAPFLPDGFSYEFHCCPKSPASIEGFTDGVLAAAQVCEFVRHQESQNEKPAGYIIACFDDTGLDAARELTEAPVVGIGEAAMHAATMISKKFCIMTTLARSIAILEGNLMSYGLANRCSGVFASNIPVLQLESDPNSYALLLDVARKVIKESQAEALVLGCAGMSHWVSQMAEDLGMPVLDGARIAIHLAATFSTLGLKTSKACSYRFPEQKTVDLD